MKAGAGFSQRSRSWWSWSGQYIPYLCIHSPKTFSNGWISLKTFSWLFPDLRHLRRISVHCHKNCNHQHWSHVIFDDESRVSLYHPHLLCFGWNNPLAFQHYDDIFGNGNNSSIGWPWTHQQISGGTNADGFSLLLVCRYVVVLQMIRSYSMASVWMRWAITSCY